ncbi:MAG: MFS transporter [Pseudomonadota bacterium]|nr:MFS transporter [Pseudomonadota bacterium]
MVAKPTLLQALRDKRMAAILFLSFASGLPFNLTNFTLQAWLASEGLSIKTIGLFSLAALPYNVKFLWAPLLDRYLPPILGRRRGWILIYQACLAVCIAVMGFCSPTKAPYVLGGVAVLLAFLSASQDIVIDAYRVDAIPAGERALAAASAAFGYRTAAMLAGAVLVWIAASLGWQLAFLFVACLMAATMAATIWAPEPDMPGRAPRTLAEAVLLPLRALLSQKGMWGFLLLVLLYKVGDAMALSLYSTFMIRGVGFTLKELSVAGKLNMTLSTMIGVAVGGIMYIRWGVFRSLLVFGIGQALTNLLYTWLALAGKKVWLLVLATALDTMVGGMGQAAFVAFLVSLCSVDFSATQYALLSALAALPRNVTGAIAGAIVPMIGWANFFVVTCLSAVPGLVLLVVLRRSLNDLVAREAANANG